MGTNLSGCWGYRLALSQALSFSSRLPGIAIDVNSTSGSAPGIFAENRDLPLFSLVLLLPFEDEDDPGTDSSKFGLGRYIGGLSLIVERVETRL